MLKNIFPHFSRLCLKMLVGLELGIDVGVFFQEIVFLIGPIQMMKRER